MKIASRITLALAAAAALMAIWQPVGTWWQFLATAFLLLLTGAGLGNTAEKKAALRELARVEKEAAEAHARAREPHPGIEAAAEAERARLGLPPRPAYGKKADR